MDRSAYDRHYQLDQSHFWRVAKRRLVLECIARYLPVVEHPQLLDIGGACSLISQQLEQFGEVTVVEPDQESVAMARAELGVRAIVGALPYDLHVKGPFDVIALLDVLEHVDDDLASLHTIQRLLTPNGVFVLTAPAYQWLWSSHDLVLHHRRRYSRSRLRQMLRTAGFRGVRVVADRPEKHMPHSVNSASRRKGTSTGSHQQTGNDRNHLAVNTFRYLSPGSRS